MTKTAARSSSGRSQTRHGESYENRTDFLSALTPKCKALDSTRLVTHVINTQGYNDNVFKLWDPLYDACDLLCLNEYIGWHVPWQGTPTDLTWQLPADKPVFISEFGGESIMQEFYNTADRKK